MGDTETVSETDAPAVDPDGSDEPKPKPPPWGSDEEFDPDQAWKLIQKLRRENSDLAPFRQKVKELEDRDKSDSEKLTERLTAAEQRAVQAEREAMRLQVAYAKGLTPAQAKRLVGDTIDDLEADADEIIAAFTPVNDEQTPAPKRRPSELVPGAVPGAEPEPDYDAIADRVRRW